MQQVAVGRFKSSGDFVVWIVVCTILSAGLPSVAQGEDSSRGAGATDARRNGNAGRPSLEKHSRKAGIALSILGAGILGGGAYLASQPRKSGCTNGWLYEGNSAIGVRCVELPIFKDNLSGRQAAGVGAMLGGSALLILGVLKMRRPPKTDSPTGGPPAAGFGRSYPATFGGLGALRRGDTGRTSRQVSVPPYLRPAGDLITAIESDSSEAH